MVMCCPKCKGMLHPADNSGEIWECEACDYKGTYPKLTPDKRAKLIEDVLSKQIVKHVLSNNPTSNELLGFVRLNIKKKRLRKKFLKNPMFYRNRLPKQIVNEYTSKKLGNIFHQAVFDTMNREGFARRVLLVQPLPEANLKDG